MNFCNVGSYAKLTIVGEYARIGLAGHVSQEELIKALLELDTLIELSGIKKQMIVLLDANIQIFVPELYDIPTILRKIGLPHVALPAVVSNGSFPESRYFYNVLHSHGGNSVYRQFVTTKSAAEWLKIGAEVPFCQNQKAIM